MSVLVGYFFPIKKYFLKKKQQQVRDDMVSVEEKNQHLNAMNHNLMNELETLTQENTRLKELHREELNQIDGVLKAVQESKNEEINHLRSELLQAAEIQNIKDSTEEQLKTITERFSAMAAHQEELKHCALAFQEAGGRSLIDYDYQLTRNHFLSITNTTAMKSIASLSSSLADSQLLSLETDEQFQRQKLFTIYCTGLLNLTSARDDRVIGTTRSFTAGKLLYFEHQTVLQRYLLRWLSKTHKGYKENKQLQLQQLSMQSIDYAAAKEQLTLLETTHSQISEKNKSLQVSAAEHSQRQQALLRDLDVANTKNKVIQQQLEEVSEKAKEVEASKVYAKYLEQKISDDDDQKVSLEKSEKDVKQLSEQLSSRSKELQISEQQLRDTSDKLIIAEASSEKDTQRLAELELRTTQLSQNCTELEITNKDLQANSTSINAKLRQHETLEDDHKSLIESNATVCIENQSLKGKITNLENQLLSQQSRSEDLQQQLSDTIEMDTTIQSLSGQLSTTGGQLAALRKQSQVSNDKLRDAEDEISQLEDDKIRSNSTIHTLQSKLKTTESHLASLKQQSQQSEDKTRDSDEKLTKAEGVISTQKLELENLQNEINSCEAQWALAKKEAAAATDRLHATEEKSLAAESEGSEAKIKNQKLQQETTELKITLDRTEREAEGLRRENEVIRRQVSDVTRKNQRIDEDLTDTTKQLTSLQKRCDTAEDVADDSTRSMSTLREQLVNAEDDTFQLRKSRNEYKQCCQQIQHDLDLDDSPLPTVVYQVNSYRQTCLQIQRLLGLEPVRGSSKSPSLSLDVTETMSERSTSPSIRWSRPPLPDLVAGVSNLQHLRTDLIRIFSLLGSGEVTNSDILTRAEHLSNASHDLLLEMGIPSTTLSDFDQSDELPLQSLVDAVVLQREMCDKICKSFGYSGDPETLDTIIEQLTTQHSTCQAMQRELGLTVSSDVTELREVVTAQNNLYTELERAEDDPQQPTNETAAQLRKNYTKYKDLHDGIMNLIPPEQQQDLLYATERSMRRLKELEAAIEYLSGAVGATSTADLKQIVSAQQAICSALEGDSDASQTGDLLLKVKSQLLIIEELKSDLDAKSLFDLRQQSLAQRRIISAITENSGLDKSEISDLKSVYETVQDQQRALRNLQTKLNAPTVKDLHEKVIAQQDIISLLDKDTVGDSSIESLKILTNSLKADQAAIERMKSNLNAKSISELEAKIETLQSTLLAVGEGNSIDDSVNTLQHQSDVIKSLQQLTDCSDVSLMEQQVATQQQLVSELQKELAIDDKENIHTTVTDQQNFINSLKEQFGTETLSETAAAIRTQHDNVQSIKSEVGVESLSGATSQLQQQQEVLSYLKDKYSVSDLPSLQEHLENERQTLQQYSDRLGTKSSLSEVVAELDKSESVLSIIQKELEIESPTEVISQVEDYHKFVKSLMDRHGVKDLPALVNVLEDQHSAIEKLKTNLFSTNSDSELQQDQPSLTSLVDSLVAQNSSLTSIQKQLAVKSPEEALAVAEQQLSVISSLLATTDSVSPEDLPSILSSKSNILQQLRSSIGVDNDDDLLEKVNDLNNVLSSSGKGFTEAVDGVRENQQLIEKLKRTVGTTSDDDLLENVQQLKEAFEVLGNNNEEDNDISKAVTTARDKQQLLNQIRDKLDINNDSDILPQLQHLTASTNNQSNVLTVLQEALNVNDTSELLEKAAEMKKAHDELQLLYDESKTPFEVLESIKDQKDVISNLKNNLNAETDSDLIATVLEQREICNQLIQSYGNDDLHKVVEESQVCKEFTNELQSLLQTTDLPLLCEQYAALTDILQKYECDPSNLSDLSRVVSDSISHKDLNDTLQELLSATSPSAIIDTIKKLIQAEQENEEVQQVVRRETTIHSPQDTEASEKSVAELVSKSYRRIRELEAEAKDVSKIANANHADIQQIGGSVSELVQSLYDQITELQKQVEGGNDEVSRLLDIIERLEARFSALQVESQGYCDEIAQLNEKVSGSHRVKIDEPDTSLSYLQKELADLTSRRSSEASFDSMDPIYQSTTMLSFRMPTPLSGRISLDSVFDGRTMSLRDKLFDDVLAQPPSTASSLSPADQKMIRDIEHEYMSKEAKYQAKISALELTVGALETANIGIPSPDQGGGSKKRDAAIRRLESEVESYISKIAKLEMKIVKLEKTKKNKSGEETKSDKEPVTLLQVDHLEKTTPQIDFSNRPSDEKQLFNQLQAELEGSSSSDSEQISQTAIFKTRIACLQDVISEKNAFITDLEIDSQTTDGRIRSLEHEIQERLLHTDKIPDANTVTIAELLLQIKEKDSLIETLRLDIVELNKRLDVNEAFLHGSTPQVTDITSLHTILNEKEAYIKSLESEVASIKDTDANQSNESLQQLLSEKDSHINSLQQLLDDNSGKPTSEDSVLINKIKELNEKSATESRNAAIKIAQLEAELQPIADVDDQRRDQIIKIATLETKDAAQQEAIESLKKTIEEQHPLKLRISELESTEAAQQVEIQSLQDTLTTAKEETNDATGKVTQLEEESELLKQKIKLLFKQQNTLQEQDDIELLRETSRNKSNRIQVLEAKVSELLSSNEELAPTQQKYEQAREELLSAREQLPILETLQQLLQTTSGSIVSQVQELVNEQQQRQNLNVSISTVMSTEEELSSKIKDMETEMDILQADKMTLRKLENENDRYEAKITTLATTCEDLQADLSQQKAETSIYSNELQEVSQKYSKADEALRSLRGGALKADAATAAVRQQCDSFKAECSSLKEELVLLKNKYQIRLDDEYNQWATQLGWEVIGSPSGILHSYDDLLLIRKDVLGSMNTSAKPSVQQSDQVQHLREVAKKRIMDEIQFWSSVGFTPTSGESYVQDDVIDVRLKIKKSIISGQNTIEQLNQLQQTTALKPSEEVNYWNSVLGKPTLQGSVSHNDVAQLRDEVKAIILSKKNQLGDTQLMKNLVEENLLWSEVLGTQPLRDDELTSDAIKTVRNRAVTLLTSDRAAEQLRDTLIEENNFWCTALDIPTGPPPTYESITNLRQEVLSTLVDKSQTLSNILASQPTLESVTSLRHRISDSHKDSSSHSATETTTPELDQVLKEEQQFWLEVLQREDQRKPTTESIKNLRNEVLEQLVQQTESLNSVLSEEAELWKDILGATHPIVRSSEISPNGVKAMRDTAVATLAENTATLNNMLTEDHELWSQILDSQSEEPDLITPSTVHTMRTAALKQLRRGDMSSYLTQEHLYWSDIINSTVECENPTVDDVQQIKEMGVEMLKQEVLKIREEYQFNNQIEKYHNEEERDFWCEILNESASETPVDSREELQRLRNRSVEYLKDGSAGTSKPLKKSAPSPDDDTDFESDRSSPHDVPVALINSLKTLWDSESTALIRKCHALAQVYL